MPGDVIRVMLVDDHAVVRAGLRAVLSQAKDISVIGEASNGREAVALVERFTPDVVIMDLSMPDMDGAAATKAIHAKNLGTRCSCSRCTPKRNICCRCSRPGRPDTS